MKINIEYQKLNDDPKNLWKTSTCPLNKALGRVLANGKDPRDMQWIPAEEPHGSWKHQRRFHLSLRVPTVSPKAENGYVTALTYGQGRNWYIMNANGNWKKGCSPAEIHAQLNAELEDIKSELSKLKRIQFLFGGMSWTPTSIA
jgi:hypothetical protein